MEKAKLVVSGKEAREKIKKGIDIVGESVRSTLGPHGRNALLESNWRGPEITNDGVSIAKAIVIEDEVANMGAQALIEAANRTNEEAGDGTSTCITIAHQLIKDGYKKLIDEENLIGQRTNVMALKKEIEEQTKEAVRLLEEQKKNIKYIKDIERVAISSVEDEELGKTIAKMVEKVGADGYIAVEDTYKNEIETEIIPGMKFTGMYCSPLLRTNNRKEAIFEKTPVLVWNGVVENFNTLAKIADQLIKEKSINKLVIIAEKFEKDVITFFLTNKFGAPNGFQFLGIKTLSLLPEEREDIAVAVGATMFDPTRQDHKEEDIGLSYLGFADKIMSNMTDFFVVGGKGNETDIKKRTAKVREEMINTTEKPLKERMKKRIGSLSGGVGIIRAGAKTKQQADYQRKKLEDSVYATKAAVEQGVVKGGGLALKEVSEKLPDGILKNALNAPYEQIQENAGGELKISKDILDPIKVTKNALEHACSAATMLLTTNIVICEKRESLIEQLKNVLKDN